jgi:predicted RNase H-like HicB family nuclease
MAKILGPKKVARYSVEFKLKAVKLSEIRGAQVQDVAEALDIHPFMLSKWRKEAREGLLKARVGEVKYLVIVEKGPTGFGAYVPDLPGCVAAAETRDEVVRLVQEAIEFQIEDLRERGEPVPPPTSTGEVVDVAAA